MCSLIFDFLEIVVPGEFQISGSDGWTRAGEVLEGSCSGFQGVVVLVLGCMWMQVEMST